MPTSVKICCIADETEAALAASAGANYVGLVGPMPSGPGVLDRRRAGEIAATAPASVAPVYLTSSETAADLLSDAQTVRASVLQIVSHIDPAEHRALIEAGCSALRWQVIHVESPEAIALIQSYDGLVDAFLLDSGRPSINELGGTGRVHDWRISRACVAATETPVFLAGGLTPHNVSEAIRSVRPHGVDLCTGVRENGALDPAKLRAFMQAVAEVT